MEFYTMDRDRRISHPILPNDIKGLFDSNIIKEYKAGKRNANSLSLGSNKTYEFTDVIFFEPSTTLLHKDFAGCLLVSDKIKSVFAAHKQSIKFKPLVLMLNKGHHVYWLFKIDKAKSTSNVSKFESYIEAPHSSTSSSISSQKEKIHGVEIGKQTRIAISLEVLEEILSIGCLGVTFQKSEYIRSIPHE